MTQYPHESGRVILIGIGRDTLTQFHKLLLDLIILILQCLDLILRDRNQFLFQNGLCLQSSLLTLGIQLHQLCRDGFHLLLSSSNGNQDIRDRSIGRLRSILLHSLFQIFNLFLLRVNLYLEFVHILGEFRYGHSIGGRLNQDIHRVEFLLQLCILFGADSNLLNPLLILIPDLINISFADFRQSIGHDRDLRIHHPKIIIQLFVKHGIDFGILKKIGHEGLSLRRRKINHVGDIGTQSNESQEILINPKFALHQHLEIGRRSCGIQLSVIFTDI